MRWTGAGAAAKAQGAIVLDADTFAATIDEVGIEGTSDLTEAEAAARQMEIRLADGDRRGPDRAAGRGRPGPRTCHNR